MVEGTTEDLVLQDEMETWTLTAFERQPPGLSTIAAIRTPIRETLASCTEEEMAQTREIVKLSAGSEDLPFDLVVGPGPHALARNTHRGGGVSLFPP